MAAVLFVPIFITTIVSGVLIHYFWGGLVLIPLPGEAGGTAPAACTRYINTVVTLVFLGQIYLGRLATPDGKKSNQHERYTR
ncbi:hypothetical protein [Halanaeroarchaeum sulfurireducens]|nr:hypothetical protein [Halanaeroarchaeum sulfurireducens]